MGLELDDLVTVSNGRGLLFADVLSSGVASGGDSVPVICSPMSTFSTSSSSSAILETSMEGVLVCATS